MATAPRPGVSRRAEAENAHISFELEGKQYTVRPAEVSASLAREFRKETGQSFQAVVAMMVNDPDIDIVQNLVWLARRQNGESVSLEDVDDFTYEQTKSLVFLDDPVEDADSPE